MVEKSIIHNGVFNKKGLNAEGFKVYQISRTVNTPHIHNRRDYYKIVLLTGDLSISFNDSELEISGTNLILVNPNLPQRVIHRSTRNYGYACVFTEAFVGSRDRIELVKNSPLGNSKVSPVISLNQEQGTYLSTIYRKVLSVYDGDYIYKDAFFKSYVEIILHEALSLLPERSALVEKNAATRITGIFKGLLERQFPIESVSESLKFRTAQDFAQAMSVHVNYLNRCVKSVTGKPTSGHISERIMTEAKALLRYTDWSIADIAYSLGFEYPTYFNNYFKRESGEAPGSIRKLNV